MRRPALLRDERAAEVLLGCQRIVSNATERQIFRRFGASPRKRLNIGQVSQELEKQFNSGIQLKFGAGGQRKGLGA